jgi:hypothetical protein
MNAAHLYEVTEMQASYLFQKTLIFSNDISTFLAR